MVPATAMVAYIGISMPKMEVSTGWWMALPLALVMTVYDTLSEAIRVRRNLRREVLKDAVGELMVKVGLS